MPLAMMVGRGNQAFGTNVDLTPVPEQEVWLVGARDIDPPEKENLRNSQVNRADISDLEHLRIDRPVHLHIDNDVIDASEVPANNYPVAEGPSLVETIEACARFASQNEICAVSFSGWNSALDFDGRTSLACNRLMKAVTEACDM
jgi:arginase